MRIIRTKTKGFKARMAELSSRGATDISVVEAAVSLILEDVSTRGDAALVELTRTHDSVNIKGRIRVSQREINRAIKRITARDKKLLELACSRIEEFHKKQVRESWAYTDAYGNILGQKLTPIERAGIYVPGGKAVYPSTVLMNAVPARTAGVKTIVMCTPPGTGGIDPLVLAAAEISGVDRIFRVGGAQAIGAMAYGTRSVGKVDKITGPGNIYVATAKRLVFGAVDIDMVAGPSEILIINDGTGPAQWIAADLLSQAEHDELATSVLVTTSAKMAREVKAEVEKQLKKLKRRDIARASLERFGAIIVARDMAEAMRISNEFAPEHLELFVSDPHRLLKRVRHAGAVFLGPLTPEAAGDYLAGPNHTLPTAGTARFSSPLGVEDFTKTTSVIEMTEDGVRALGPSTKRFAMLEGLEAHAKSMAARGAAGARQAKTKKRRG